MPGLFIEDQSLYSRCMLRNFGDVQTEQITQAHSYPNIDSVFTMVQLAYNLPYKTLPTNQPHPLAASTQPCAQPQGLPEVCGELKT